MISDISKHFLTKLLILIEKPESYNSTWFAKDSNGKSVLWDHPDAVKFNLEGAIEFLGMADPIGKQEINDELERVLSKTKFRNTSYFTPDNSHEQVLGLLNAILENREWAPPAPPMILPEPTSAPLVEAIKNISSSPTYLTAAVREAIQNEPLLEKDTGKVITDIPISAPKKRGGRPKGALGKKTLARLAKEAQRKGEKK